MLPIEHFWRAAAEFPDCIAVSSSERNMSYAELAAAVAHLAVAIQRHSANPDDRIGVGSRNSVEHLVAILAVLASGRVWVPLNPRAGTPELLRIVEFSDPALVILDDEMAGRLGDLRPTWLLSILGAEKSGPILRDPAGDMPAVVNRDLGEAQAIKFTGGTTGHPKGVMQTGRSWHTVIVSKWAAFGFDRKERFLIAAPLTHGSSTYLLPILGRGGTIVLAQDSAPSSILDAMERQSVTSTFLPPILIHGLVRENGIRRRRTDTLRHLIYAAAPMSVDQIRETQSAFGPVLATTYGQTEAPQIVTCLSTGEMMLPQYAGSVGRASLLTRVAVTDPAGSPVPVGEEGHVRVRGDIVMGGYWRAPELTAAAIVDGWLETGDRGYLDAGGYLFLKGRADDVIISGGFNVHPGDVEAVLARHAGVEQCVVVGVADERWGEAVHAAVVPTRSASVSEDELIAFVKAELGSINAPKRIYFVEELPRTAVDKVSRRQVRQLLKSRLGP